jgi:hypothetical protein
MACLLGRQAAMAARPALNSTRHSLPVLVLLRKQALQLLDFKRAFANGEEILGSWVDDPDALEPHCASQWDGVVCNDANEVTEM